MDYLFSLATPEPEPAPPAAKPPRKDRLYAFWKKHTKVNESNTKATAEQFVPDDDGILSDVQEEETIDVEASERSASPTPDTVGRNKGPSRTTTNLAKTNNSSHLAKCLVATVVGGLVTLVVLTCLLLLQHNDDDTSNDPALKAFQESSQEFLQHVSRDFVAHLYQLHTLEQTVANAVGTAEAVDTLEEAAFWCTDFANDWDRCTTWPFVTLPSWDELVLETKESTPLANDNNAVLTLYPRVPAEYRQMWRTYAINNGLAWVEDAYESQQQQDNGSANDSPNYWETNKDWFVSEWAQQNVQVPDDWAASTFGIATQVFRRESTVVGNATTTTTTSLMQEEDDDTTTWFPQWQAAPLSPTVHAQVNWNLASELGVARLESARTLFRTFQSPDSDTANHGPDSQLLYPIRDENNNNVVARMGLQMTWADRFQSAHLQLSKTTGPMVVIVEDSASNQTFRFHVDQDQVEYISDSELEQVDWYDFAKLEMSSLRGALESRLQTSNDTSSSYTGSALSRDFDSYLIRVHPSTEFYANDSKDDDEDNLRGLLTLIICIVAAGLLVAFIAHGCLVRKREQALKRSALQADAVVSSLFPSQVKEKLYEQKQQELGLYEQQQYYPTHARRLSNETAQRRNSNEATARRRNSNETARRRNSNESTSVTASRRNSNDASTKGASAAPVDEDQGDVSHSTFDDDAPIAEHYESATILFADIAGFTKWSAKREPSEVFEFLERLYGGFDANCAKYHVFKIETIGDCYVCVCGLPERTIDHAVCMVQFAIEMLRVFREVQLALGDRLEAHKLGLRTGIHSGPVTAGVLRGERARFQLFGDSVNTTARHESSGKPGRIHVSKETAALLSQAGHDSWIRPRKHKVQMKGKGTLPTWWVNTGEEGVLTEMAEQAEWAWSSLFYCQT